MGQRKKQKQFIHNKSNFIKGQKYCKRKALIVESEECVPKKVQILDMEDVNEEIVSEMCNTESVCKNEESENVFQSATSEYSDTISESTHSFYISEKKCEKSKCLSGNNDSNDLINSMDT